MATRSTILIVEDDPGIRRGLSEGLKDLGYETVTASTGEEALTKLGSVVVALALVDLKLPGMDGVDLLRELRRRSPTTEVVIVSAQPSVESAIEALRMGAFDYLVKPFTLDQVEQVVGRGLEQRQRQETRGQFLRQLERDLAGLSALETSTDSDSIFFEPVVPTSAELLRCGPFEIDLPGRRARIDGRELDLTDTEFRFLVALVNHAPRVIAPQELARSATGYQISMREARELVKWYIHHLRRKIEPDPRTPRYILNVRGVGYRLVFK